MYYDPITRNRANDIVHLWNQEIGDEFPLRKELLIQNSYEDTNVLAAGSCLAVDESGNLIGFIITKKYQEAIEVGFNSEIGWIQVLLVKTENRNRGIGTELLRRAEDALEKSGAKKIILGKDVWHYFPGIPDHYVQVKQWFVSRNYHFDGREYDLLTETPVLQIPEVKEARFSLLNNKNDQGLLLDFLHRCFPGRWEYEAIKYFEMGGDGREFVILKNDVQVIGFCRINDHLSHQIAQNIYWSPLFTDGLGGMGPLGIDAAERGKGYGLALVQAGIAYLSRRGLKHFIIDWTQLIDFYKKVGAHPWKSYATYFKSLENEKVAGVR